MELNQSQREAVTHDDGPMMVLAGPGSGKTMVITHRVQYLIQKVGVQPSGILVVTFTKAAAEEMRQRFLSLMKEETTSVWFGTFHAIFFAVLRHAYHYTAANIIRDEQRYQLMRELLEETELETDNINELAAEILGEIGKVKGGLIDIEHYYATSCSASVFRQLYRQYQEQMANKRLIDFEDMLVYTWELFNQRSDISRAWQQKFQYILIDEFQDINLLQYRLVQMLAKPQNNLFVVGDDDQSIYAFRGARPEIMLNFEKDFPSVKKVFLSVNYRCQGAIVAGAGRVIAHNKQRFAKKIRAASDFGTPIDIRAFASPMRENETVRKEIMAYHEAKMPYAQMAVLFRTHTQARLLLEKLMEFNIPFRMQDTMPNIYQHWICQDLMAYFRIAEGSRARGDYLRIINRPNRYVSRQAFSERQTDIHTLIAFYEGKPWLQERLAKMRYDLQLMARMSPFAAINYIRHGMGYEEFLEDYAKSHAMDVTELKDILDELQESAKEYKTYAEWLSYIKDFTEQLKNQAKKNSDSQTDAVSLATMHHAKGLEYQVVFIVDANEKITPHHKAILEADIEEERRMFYVAMTRAKTDLHIYFLKERFGRPMQMSRFVGEILGNGEH